MAESPLWLVLDRQATVINVLDAIGLSVFAVLGAYKALDMGFGVVQAILVGAITAVGAAPFATC